MWCALSVVRDWRIHVSHGRSSVKRILTIVVESEDVHVLNAYTDALHSNASRVAGLAEVSVHDISIKVIDQLA